MDGGLIVKVVNATLLRILTAYKERGAFDDYGAICAMIGKQHGNTSLAIDYAYLDCAYVQQCPRRLGDVLSNVIDLLDEYADYELDTSLKEELRSNKTAIDAGYQFVEWIFYHDDYDETVEKEVFRYKDGEAQYQLLHRGEAEDDVCASDDYGVVFDDNNDEYDEDDDDDDDDDGFLVFSNGLLYSYDGTSRCPVIPPDVTTIGESVFTCNEALEEIDIPHGVTAIGNGAFSCCYNLKRVTLPNTLRTIGEGAFVMCDSLTEIVIPDGCESIEEGCFKLCKNLMHIYIPASVQSIGDCTLLGAPDEAVVHTPAGSAAEHYAEENFILVETE